MQILTRFASVSEANIMYRALTGMTKGEYFIVFVDRQSFSNNMFPVLPYYILNNTLVSL